VAKDKPAGGQYGEVVARLQHIVESLETGSLSLEESLERFGEGVGLVKQGEKLLTDAERRIEQLLSEEGRTAPLKIAETPEVTSPPSGPSPLATKAARKAMAPSAEDDDVPF
jgi:exodeoxyribonuclease VII small subunit